MKFYKSNNENKYSILFTPDLRLSLNSTENDFIDNLVKNNLCLTCHHPKDYHKDGQCTHYLIDEKKCHCKEFNEPLSIE